MHWVGLLWGCNILFLSGVGLCFLIYLYNSGIVLSQGAPTFPPYVNKVRSLLFKTLSTNPVRLNMGGEHCCHCCFFFLLILVLPTSSSFSSLPPSFFSPLPPAPILGSYPRIFSLLGNFSLHPKTLNFLFWASDSLSWPGWPWTTV